MKHIFIAGPYAGDQAINVCAAVIASNTLLEAGYVPYVPHLTHFWDMIRPQFRNIWLQYHLNWLRRCDALLRLPGFSKGADEELDFALTLNIPVFASIKDLIATMPPHD